MKKNIMITIVILSLSPIFLYGQEAPDTLSIWVNGACGMCETRIEKVALSSRGVTSANWDVESKMLKLTINEKFKSERLHYKIASAGHDTREILAPDAVYEALPACCHYRPGDHGNLVHGSHTPLVSGKVIETNESGSSSLAGANVYWAGTTRGVITDAEGFFEIEFSNDRHMLVVSYVGYGRDTFHVDSPKAFEVEFKKSHNLEEVEIIFRSASSSFDLSNPFNIQDIHEKELLKAACCNLSESFETNPAVDVSFTDAVTGTRQIEMLGLAGPYVQITRENMPNIRGLAALYGLTYIPGPWISGIQLNTGTGSVVNGFESITGQINVELKKPEDSELLYLNLFGNQAGRMEANLNLAHSFNEKWHTGLLLHGKYQSFEFDNNNDGFMDHPEGTNAIILHRWKYQGEDGLQSQAGFKATIIRNKSGQTDFDHNQDYRTQSFWGAEMNTTRLEAWLKIGKVFPAKPYSSVGFQLSGMSHLQDGFFGSRTYDAQQKSLYANLIYQGIIKNTNHQFRTGTSFQLDTYNEELASAIFLRNEMVPGIFLEYTYNYLDKFSAVSGIRADHHNNFGSFITPRLHLRYAISEQSVIKLMAGRGQKTASIIAENIGVLASSRMLVIDSLNSSLPYGLDPEIAWNSGISFAQEFKLAGKEGLFKLDYYYTWFINQIIVNYDRDPGMLIFQNLDGKSFSGSFQAQVDYELFPRYDVRLAYRFNDVKSTVDGELLQEALTPRHRAFINMAYETLDHWKFDLTMNWQGKKRIPNTMNNPEEFQLEQWSPDFFLWNAQISKQIGKSFEIYLGGENLFNFKQADPIIDAENPFGDYFDASLIWGPVFGRKIYGGLRVRLG